MNNEIGRIIKNNVQRLIQKKIIRSEKDLDDPTLDVVDKIANELDICIKDIVCSYCCDFNNCEECEEKRCL